MTYTDNDYGVINHIKSWIRRVSGAKVGSDWSFQISVSDKANNRYHRIRPLVNNWNPSPNYGIKIPTRVGIGIPVSHESVINPAPQYEKSIGHFYGNAVRPTRLPNYEFPAMERPPLVPLVREVRPIDAPHFVRHVTVVPAGRVLARVPRAQDESDL